MAFVTCETYTAGQTAQDATIASQRLRDCDENWQAPNAMIPTCAQMATAIGAAIGAIPPAAATPTALTHTWNALGDGSGTITLTFSDGSTLTAPMAAIPATC
jgi:hypothetical protein